MPDYVLEGPKWGAPGLGTSGGTVTWAVDASIPSFFTAQISAAFADWSKYGNISFLQVGSTSAAQLDFTTAHIDGSNNTLGYASYHYSGGAFSSAEIKFDSDEGWHVSGGDVVSNYGAKLFITALHEIGHAIGLDHYDGGSAVMNSMMNLAVADLTSSDIHGVTALYGPSASANRALSPSKPLSVSDLLSKPASDTLQDLVDFDGNHLGAVSSWKIIGQADIQGDHDMEYILVNPELGRWATLGPNVNNVIDLADHGQGGETRVVGVYIDPLVTSGIVQKGSAIDSQQRFANDLRSGNIDKIFGAADYDGNGLQEVYFGLKDHTAVLHAYMHSDGNIQYANYQSGGQMNDYLSAHGYHTDWVL